MRIAWTHCICIASSFESFDVEVDGAPQRICKFIVLNYLDEFHTSTSQNQHLHSAPMSRNVLTAHRVEEWVLSSATCHVNRKSSRVGVISPTWKDALHLSSIVTNSGDCVWSQTI